MTKLKNNKNNDPYQKAQLNHRDNTKEQKITLWSARAGQDGYIIQENVCIIAETLVYTSMLESIMTISISIRRRVLWSGAVIEKCDPLELNNCKAAGPTNIARQAKRKKNYTHTPEMSDMW